MGKEKMLSVWGARGGHGATTLAAVIASFLDARVVGRDSWAADWILGRSTRETSSGIIHDAGSALEHRGSSTLDIVVLRGPCSTSLSSLKNAGSIDRLVVVREPWRAIETMDAQAILGAHHVIEIPFSERIARLSDAGLLGSRLDRLEEFAAVQAWVRSAYRSASPS